METPILRLLWRTSSQLLAQLPRPCPHFAVRSGRGSSWRCWTTCHGTRWCPTRSVPRPLASAVQRWETDIQKMWVSLGTTWDLNGFEKKRIETLERNMETCGFHCCLVWFQQQKGEKMMENVVSREESWASLGKKCDLTAKAGRNRIMIRNKKHIRTHDGETCHMAKDGDVTRATGAWVALVGHKANAADPRNRMLPSFWPRFVSGLMVAYQTIASCYVWWENDDVVNHYTKIVTILIL